MDLVVPEWEKNMFFACHTIAHGTDLRRSPLKSSQGSDQITADATKEKEASIIK